MDRGSYVAASSGLMQLRRLEVVANNLANVNTAGFKRQIMTGEVQSFDQTLAALHSKDDPFARGDHQRTPGVVNVRAVTDFSPGSIRTTGNPLDVALQNEKDFFVVGTPDGLQYTRAGNFTLNSEGELVTMDGFQVQGDGGPITVPGGVSASIAPSGAVMANGVSVGRLRVVRAESLDSFQRVGSARFKVDGGAPQPADVEADVIPQSLEMANVSAISSVVEMISAQRAFQMYTKTAEASDSLNQIAINQIGRRQR